MIIPPNIERLRLSAESPTSGILFSDDVSDREWSPRKKGWTQNLLNLLGSHVPEPFFSEVVVYNIFPDSALSDYSLHCFQLVNVSSDELQGPDGGLSVRFDIGHNWIGEIIYLPVINKALGVFSAYWSFRHGDPSPQIHVAEALRNVILPLVCDEYIVTTGDTSSYDYFVGVPRLLNYLEKGYME